MYIPKLSNLPPILTDNVGNKVTTTAEWEQKRRGEILDLFADNVYGRVPELDTDVSYSIKREETGEAIEYVITTTTTTKYGSHSFDSYVSVPKTGTPCPVIEVIQFHYQTTSEFKAKVLARGYALARFYYTDICTDDNDHFTTGLHAVVKEHGGARRSNTWGAVASWAWAASRLMDALEDIPEIDTSRAAILGHSRTGKASLWCGATDERFKLVMSNESGCGGTAITRGKVGEHIKNICEGFPCWFCANYKTFGADEEHMPFDQHMLLALIAPRCLYVPSAIDDQWSGPEPEYLAAKYVGEIYELYGKKGLSLDHYPVVGTVDQSGSVAYHLRRGGHKLSTYDWDEYLNYADKVLK